MVTASGLGSIQDCLAKTNLNGKEKETKHTKPSRMGVRVQKIHLSLARRRWRGLADGGQDG